MRHRSVVVLLAVVASCAALSLPLGALVMPVALLLVMSGFLATITGATELSGRLLAAGFALAVFGSLWGALAHQARAFLVAAFHAPAAMGLLAVMALALIAIVLAKAWGRPHRQKPAPPRSRPRAHLVEPALPPEKPRNAEGEGDDLGIFGDRHG